MAMRFSGRFNSPKWHCKIRLEGRADDTNGFNPMKGHVQTLRQAEWHLGPDWPGKRCGARTRNGTPCLKPALSGKTRCLLHGGRAGAPSGMRNGNYKHGRNTKEAIATRRAAIARIRALVALGKAAGLY
jgi:glucans biosynthesis protein